MSSSEMSLSSASISHDIRRPSETSTAESLVDTVYDISIKEEDARQELQDVDQNISRLQKLIEESTIELKKYKEKKLSVCKFCLNVSLDILLTFIIIKHNFNKLVNLILI
jgi:K+-sensing histidine kinase KdpD